MFPILRKFSYVKVVNYRSHSFTDYLILGFCVYRCEIELHY